MLADGLIIATSGIPDNSCTFLDGKVIHNVSSVNVHCRPLVSPTPRTMMKFRGSPYFGDQFSLEQILNQYDFVLSVGTKVNNRCTAYYKSKFLGSIQEMFFGMSSHYGVTIEMRVDDSALGEYKERFKMVPWVTFAVNSEVEFTNA